jgi:hypothetical protein
VFSAREFISVVCPVMNAVYDVLENLIVLPAMRAIARSFGATRSMICLGMFVIAMAKSIHWVIKNVVPKITAFVRKYVMSHPIVVFYLDEVACAVCIILFCYKLKTTLESFLEIRKTYKNYRKMNTKINVLKEQKKALESNIRNMTRVKQALIGDIEGLIA